MRKIINYAIFIKKQEGYNLDQDLREFSKGEFLHIFKHELIHVFINKMFRIDSFIVLYAFLHPETSLFSGFCQRKTPPRSRLLYFLCSLMHFFFDVLSDLFSSVKLLLLKRNFNDSNIFEELERLKHCIISLINKEKIEDLTKMKKNELFRFAMEETESILSETILQNYEAMN